MAANTTSLTIDSISGSHSNERSGPLVMASRRVRASATTVISTITTLSAREPTRIRRSRTRADDAESATCWATRHSSSATWHRPRSGNRAATRRCSVLVVFTTSTALRR